MAVCEVNLFICSTLHLSSLSVTKKLMRSEDESGLKFMENKVCETLNSTGLVTRELRKIPASALSRFNSLTSDTFASKALLCTLASGSRVGDKVYFERTRTSCNIIPWPKRVEPQKTLRRRFKARGIAIPRGATPIFYTRACWVLEALAKSMK
jgi:hypothetical protein